MIIAITTFFLGRKATNTSDPPLCPRTQNSRMKSPNLLHTLSPVYSIRRSPTLTVTALEVIESAACAWSKLRSPTRAADFVVTAACTDDHVLYSVILTGLPRKPVETDDRPHDIAGRQPQGRHTSSAPCMADRRGSDFKTGYTSTESHRGADYSRTKLTSRAYFDFRC